MEKLERIKVKALEEKEKVAVRDGEEEEEDGDDERSVQFERLVEAEQQIEERLKAMQKVEKLVGKISGEAVKFDGKMMKLLRSYSWKKRSWWSGRSAGRGNCWRK